MIRKSTSSFQQVLEKVESLSSEDQEALIEVVRHRLVERRRAKMARNAEATLKAVREGKAACGSVQDLEKDVFQEG